MGKTEIRDTLFGDLPLAAWPPASAAAANENPWRMFVDARQALAAGRRSDAADAWQRILAMDDLESRHYLQAWHFLRELGVLPALDRTKVLLGIVVEVGMERGLDLLAAYVDHTARYFNFSGSYVIWERPDESLDGQIDALLAAGQELLQQIGPWTEPRPPAPRSGQLRINLLSPAGLHFGQGPLAALATDPLARPTFDAATALMQRLIARQR